MSVNKDISHLNLLLLPLAVLALAGFGAFFYIGMPTDDASATNRGRQVSSKTVNAPVAATPMTPDEKMKLIKNDDIAGAAVPTDAGQAVSVVVDSGFVPNVIQVKKGVPLTVKFIWKSTAADKDMKVVFPSLGTLMVIVPKNGKVSLVVPIPNEAGKTIEFTCGMKLLKGRLTTVD